MKERKQYFFVLMETEDVNKLLVMQWVELILHLSSVKQLVVSVHQDLLMNCDSELSASSQRHKRLISIWSFIRLFSGCRRFSAPSFFICWSWWYLCETILLVDPFQGDERTMKMLYWVRATVRTKRCCWLFNIISADDITCMILLWRALVL